MSKPQLPKCLKSSSPTFSGRRIDLYQVDHKEVVIHPGAVVILPIISDSEIIMIRNERFAVDENLLELPAGTLEQDEEPATTAARELIEETGYRAKVLEPLFAFYTTPGFCNEMIHAFVAKDLEFVGQNLDESEKITTEVFTWEAILQMLRDGTIHDGKTIATLLYYQSFLIK